MQTLIIAVLAAAGFIVAYHTYGRWLGSRIFSLSADTVCPSHRLNDGNDYVPTSKAVVFGHHFTSIAGTGPIVGPAIAVMWGWLPALLWVIFGSIFIGAVHDFGALVVSLRNNGQTVGDIAGRVMNCRVRILFLLILFLALTVVLAIFGVVIGGVFRMYPAAIFPCLIQIPIAIGIGLWLHRKGAGLIVPSVLALGLMYLAVIFGNAGWLGWFNTTLAEWSTMTWVVVLLVYSYVASVLPVWTLLQPRDFINSLQLITALGLVFAGLVVAGVAGGSPVVEGGARTDLIIVAPTFQWDPLGAPVFFPFLFITIACGAISGFHCLVSSGTSSKQVSTEPDARFIGYGAMLTEGFLATVVILACTAGIGLGIPLAFSDDADSVASYTDADGVAQTLAMNDVRGSDSLGSSIIVDPNASDEAAGAGVSLVGAAAWNTRYSSWSAAGSLPAKVGAFVDGAGNFLKSLGIPGGVAIALMGVLVASFAGTTLDTGCRLQRYVIQELAQTFSDASFNPIAILRNKHAATIFAVALATLLASVPPTGLAWSWANAGKGGLILWPLFGATNQLLGGLSFIVIAFYLWRRGKPVWFLVAPMIFMLAMPLLALIWQVWIGNDQINSWVDDGNWLLVAISVATLALEIWMIAEAIAMFPKARGVIEDGALDIASPSSVMPASNT